MDLIFVPSALPVDPGQPSVGPRPTISSLNSTTYGDQVQWQLSFCLTTALSLLNRGRRYAVGCRRVISALVSLLFVHLHMLFNPNRDGTSAHEDFSLRLLRPGGNTTSNDRHRHELDEPQGLHQLASLIYADQTLPLFIKVALLSVPTDILACRPTFASRQSRPKQLAIEEQNCRHYNRSHNRFTRRYRINARNTHHPPTSAGYRQPPTD